MSIDAKLLEILRCPVTKQHLFPLSPDKLASLNAAISAGTVAHQDGSSVTTTLTDALITANGATVYKIIEDIPIMLEDQCIPDFEFVKV